MITISAFVITGSWLKQEILKYTKSQVSVILNLCLKLLEIGVF